MTLAAHRFRSVEFWITVLIFSTVLACRKNNKYWIFKIQNWIFQIGDLPRKLEHNFWFFKNELYALLMNTDCKKVLDLPQQFLNEILNFGSLCLCKTLHNWQNKPGEKLWTPINHSPQIWQNIFIQKTIRWWTVMSLEKTNEFLSFNFNKLKDKYFRIKI